MEMKAFSDFCITKKQKMSFNIIAQHGTVLPLQLLQIMVNPVILIGQNQTEETKSFFILKWVLEPGSKL